MLWLVGRVWHYCVTGLLILIPSYATFLILSTLFNTLDAIVIDVLGRYLEVRGPGVGLVLLIVLIVSVGMIATRVIGQRLVGSFEKWVERIPFVRSVYLTLKGMTDLFNYRSRFGGAKVVAFPFPRDGLWALGFVMGTAPTALQAVPVKELMMVFVPTAIHPFTGYLAFVPQDLLRPLRLTPEDALKVEFSAGLFQPTRGWLSPRKNP